MDERESKFKFFSLGIVLEDKVRGSDQIKVYPVEQLPQIDGKISDYKPGFNAKGVDARGVKTETKLEGDGVIVAEWFPDGADNRMTSPDVIKNESVKIYRYADTDTYLWKTIYREPSLRRLETVCYMFGDLISGLAPMDKESSYWFEISTHDQHIKLHTSNSNGEPFTYDFKLDTASGNLLITDNVGNSIELNSKTSYIGLKNGEGTEYLMDGPDLTLNIPGTYTVNAGHYINNSPTDHNKTVNLNQGYNVTGDNGSGNSATSTGNIKLIGQIDVSGDIIGQANVNIDGVVTAGDFKKK